MAGIAGIMAITMTSVSATESSLRERLMALADASLLAPLDPTASRVTAADVRGILAAIEADLRRGTSTE